MTINSLTFLIFFTVLVVLYYLPIFKNCQWVLLLLASFVFYGSASSGSVIYLLVASVATYFGANLLEKKNVKQETYLKENKGSLSKQEVKEYKGKIKKEKHKITVVCVVVNLGLLILIKYGLFLAKNVELVFKNIKITELSIFHIIIPLGISYYTLMSIGYLLDVSKGKCKAEKNLLKTVLYLIYFPQITQGPIGRFTEMAPRLFEKHEFTYEKLAYGCQRILWGFFKKMVIADRMKPMVDAIFTNYQDYSGFTVALGCIYFSIQLYADFSGYMDIVCGCSHILGIELAENFKRPFFSKSLAEFWRRWHITLCAWFRDYMFYPLSISKGAVRAGRIAKKIFPPRIAKLAPSVFALSIIWLCTGIWHEASWRYILWGVYNGVIIIGAMCLEPQFAWAREKLHLKEENKVWSAFQMIRTFLIISLLKVFPLAGSTMDSIRMFLKIFTDFRVEFTVAAWFPQLQITDYVAVGAGLIIFFIVSTIQEKGPAHEKLNKLPFVVRFAIYFVLLLGILSFGVFDVEMAGGFEYAQY